MRHLIGYSRRFRQNIHIDAMHEEQSRHFDFENAEGITRYVFEAVGLTLEENILI